MRRTPMNPDMQLTPRELRQEEQRIDGELASFARPPGSAPVIRLWVVEYEHNGHCYRTVVEHYTRDEAMTRFRRDNPHVELRECY